MPHPADRSRFPKTDRAAIARAYGGKQAHERALAIGQTELGYEDWLTVRTPAFKAWFGDWQAARGVEQLGRIRPLSLDGERVLPDKETVETAFRTFEKVENTNDGRSVSFPANTVGKILRHRGFNVRLIVAAFDRLFAMAVPMFSETEQIQTGHKSHPGVAGYHHYVALFEQREMRYYVRFTVHQMHAGRKKPRGAQGDAFVHSSFVSEVSRYEKGTESSTPHARGWVIDPVLTPALEDSAPSDVKLAQWLAAGKSENLSSALNPRTREPTAQAIRDYEGLSR